MDTTIQKSYYNRLEGFVKEYLSVLKDSRVFIFGAGMRGCNLLQLLRMFQVSDIFFVDNSSHMQGKRIGDCRVLSFEEAVGYSGKHLFLCPVENGGAILEQLERAGKEEGKEYFNLDFRFADYLELVEEIKKTNEGDTLIFGACSLSSCVLGDEIIPAFGDVLREKLFGERCKVYAMPGGAPELYYHILNVLLRQKLFPERVIIATSLSSISPYNSVMMRKHNLEQHRLLAEELVGMGMGTEEIQEFMKINERRMKRSLEGGKPVKDVGLREAIKKVYKLKYLYTLREEDDSVVYTKKILKQMNELNIPVYIQFQPVDYQRGQEICGGDFMVRYSEVKNLFLSYIQGYSYYEVDASFIATSDCFVPAVGKPDINPILNRKGQDMCVRYLENQEVLQPFLHRDSE